MRKIHIHHLEVEDIVVNADEKRIEKNMPYTLPDRDLLNISQSNNYDEEYNQARLNADIIEEKTDELGARLNIEDIRIGPQVISFYCAPSEKVLVRLLPRLAAELQFELGCETISIHAPQPGTKHVVIEVPNPRRQLVTLGDIIDSASA